MILDVKQLIRVIIWHITLGGAVYYFSPTAAFVYFIGATLVGVIQNYEMHENVKANQDLITMYRKNVPQLDAFINKIDEALEDIE